MRKDFIRENSANPKFHYQKKNWHPNWLCGGVLFFLGTVFLCLPLVALLFRNLVNHPPRVGKPCCTFCNEIFRLAVTPPPLNPQHCLKIHRLSPQNYGKNSQWIYWDVKWSYHFGSALKIHPNLGTPAALYIDNKVNIHKVTTLYICTYKGWILRI